MSTENLRDAIDQITADANTALAAGSWWHSIDLGHGVITQGVHSAKELKDNYERFKLPEDLSGKRLLDFGCWDGFYSL